jgi:thermitase
MLFAIKQNIIKKKEMMKKSFCTLILALLLVQILTFELNPPPDKEEIKNIVNPAYKSNWQDIKTELQREREFEDKGPENLTLSKNWDLRSYQTLRHLARCDAESIELIVGVEGLKNQTQALKKTILNEGGTITGTISTAEKVQAITVKVPIIYAYSFAERLQKNGLAKYVEPNLKAEAFFTPNDPYWPNQWGPKKIEAESAWDTMIGLSSILVAIVDTGIAYTHADLTTNYVSLGYDWVNEDANPMDDNGHGTHCAGIVAAQINNSIGIAGLAQVHIMTEKVLDSGGWGYYSWVSQGIIHATDQGAKIISMSLGGSSDSQALHDAVKYAYDHGVLIVAAAGNTATDEKHYPAAYDEVIAVTATDSSDNLASFSTFGDWVELAAPGVDIYSTYPSNSYTYMSGTSMACPHVTGVAALTWSLFTNYTRDQIRKLLRRSTDDLGETGFDRYYGYGRVNARRALQGLPEHDISISEWQHPHRVDPGQSVIFNVTVSNFGTKNETDISTQLFINETLTDSTTIAFLAVDSSANVSFPWTATTLGNYNVTCYIVPVPEENLTENNIASADMFVRPPVTLRVPDDFPTIREAVDKAGEGDTVSVGEGYYDEGQINIFKNNITLVADGNASLDGWRAVCVFNVFGDFVTIDGFDIRNCSAYGIKMKGYGNTLTNNKIIDNREPVDIYESNGCNISLNYVITHSGGFVINRCSNCTISKNTLIGNSNEGGFHIYFSFNNTISENNITGGILRIALEIYYSENNFILSNTVTENEYGLGLAASPNNILRNNVMANNTCNFCVWTEDVLAYPWQTVDDVDTSNTVDGKPIYYWIDVRDAIVPSDAGCVVLVYCENIKVENLTLKNNLHGIFLVNSSNIQIRFNNITNNNGFSWNPLCGGIGAVFDCSNITISQNKIKDNAFGIWLWASNSNCNVSLNNITGNALWGVALYESSNTIISLNNISNNEGGVSLSYSSNNTISLNNIIENEKYGMNNWLSPDNVIFHNNFANKGGQAYSYECVNKWDDGYPSGGNYWSDYAGVDANGDGIGDTPYIIDEKNIDQYPLIRPYEWPHDVGIANPSTSKTIVGQGYSVNISATIKNYGKQTETFNITFQVGLIKIQVQTITLTAGNSTPLILTWNTDGFDYGPYLLIVSLDTVSGEIYTVDNIFTVHVLVTIPGDISGDFNASLTDLVILAGAYGCKSGDVEWNPNADIDNNGKVGLSDLVILARNYGQSYP